jgi:hypothetical protein
MHTQRRFFLAFVSVAIGIAVPMTLKPSTAMLVVLWALIAVALLGAVVTWQPVARRIPFRVVHTVSPQIASDAALAEQCAAYAHDVRRWLKQHDMPTDEEFEANPMTWFKGLPQEFRETFDGRTFDILDKLRQRGCITQEDVRQHTEDRRLTLGHARGTADLAADWGRRLRRR